MTSGEGDVTSQVHRVTIEERDGMHFLLRLDQGGRCVADTCHLTMEEALGQAQFEYELIEGKA